MFWQQPPIVVFYISSLVARWDLQRIQWGRGARNLHLRAGQIQLDPSLDGGWGFTVAGREWVSETTNLGILLWTPFSSVLPSSLTLRPCPWPHWGYLIFFLFFFSGAAPIASSHISVEGDRVPGDQGPPTSRICSSQIKGWGPVWHPLRGHDLARVFHICWPTSTQEAQVGAFCNGLTPNSPKGQSSLTYPPPQGGNILTEMTTLHVNVGDTHWVYHCWVEGCPDGPLSSHATICSYVCQAHLGMKLSCSLCPIIFF